MLSQSDIMPRSYWVYILASERNGTLYIGVTNDLARRVYEHKTKAVPGFTSRYDVGLLVWYEEYSDVNDAIAREKALKRWERKWKLQLIAATNPQWFDLYETLNR
ncbi:putative endonuclease [Beijerinckia sp. GAS462]|nr:putative endonuclease [Beijerinckia sp. GAS462]SEB70954.1 putative endonuclease [Beijerinckia sp. 28-YEA-48]